jgi:hypothetical protein
MPGRVPSRRRASWRQQAQEDISRTVSTIVDLVVASAIKNPYFRVAADRTKALLYAAEARKYLHDIR